MSAKHKLNEANLLVCLLIAALVGGFTQSFLAFVFTLLVMSAAAIHGGSLRR